MANYVLGFGTQTGSRPTCCLSCSTDNPCQSKPTTNEHTEYGTVGVFSYHPLATVSQWTSGATWSVPDLALYSGATLNASTGFFGWSPTAAGTYFIGFTATTACGTSDLKIMTLSVDVTFCRLTVGTSGGDGGYSSSFYVAPDFVASRNIYIDFESYTVKDRLRIYADGVEIYNSGCIGGRVTPTVNVPGGTINVDVYVDPRCEGGSASTLWVLEITCA